MNKIELLAPAGNFEALAAAVESGADAVYLGGNKFSARAYADNFDGQNLARAVSYAHIRGVKVFVTVNILISDRELEEALDYVNSLYQTGVDGIIVQDIALLKLVVNAFPDLPVHCSTQMVVHNAEGVRYYSGLGAKRIVLARELSLEQVRSIAESTGVDLEIFIHGALCVSYSGQCLMSSLIGGRSGNRGRCAQPCRKKYSLYDFNTGREEAANRNKHILSTRDLNTYNRLKELAESGVASLKIEGRMKRPEYVAIVVKHYRNALDNIYTNNAYYELKSAFNREFTEGYLFGKRNRQVVSIDRPDNRGVKLGRVISQKGEIASILIEENSLNDGDGIEIVSGKGKSTGAMISGIRVKGKSVKGAVAGDIAEVFIREKVEAGSEVTKTFDSGLNKKAREEYSSENTRKITLRCRLIMKTGQYPMIEVMDNDGNIVRHTDDERVEMAEKAATPVEKILEQLSKTGDTPYRIQVAETEIDDDCYIPARQINRMRRKVLELLSEKRSLRFDRKTIQFNGTEIIKSLNPVKENLKNDLLEYIAGIRNYEAAVCAINSGVDSIYILSDAYEGDVVPDTLRIAESCKNMDKSLFYVLPNIMPDKEKEKTKGRLESIIKKADLKHFGAVISEPGQLDMVRSLGIDRIRTNYNMNVFNSVSAGHWQKEGAEAVGLSAELKLPQIKEINSNIGVATEAVVYGYLPVMTTEYCPVSLCSKGCNYPRGCNSSNYGIIDEKGKNFRIIKLDSCRTQILNSDVLLMADDLGDVISSGVMKLRADFYIESPEMVGRIIKLYKSFNNVNDKDRLLVKEIKSNGFTKGHFYRGVD